MKLISRTFLAASGLCLALSSSSLAQTQTPSLAELARQQRARKSESPKKVLTNDDIPAATISGTPAEAATPPSQAPAASSEQAATPGAAGEEQPSQEELEKEYREKFAKAKEDLDMQERKLDVLQRELNLMQQQFYSDPNVQLQQEYSRENINKRVEEIEAQKQVVEKAKQVIADLETELQRKGLPPGWAR